MCYSFGIMHPPRCCRPPAGNIVGALYQNCNTQSSAPEDGRNHRPKYVELIGVINKPLLLHLVGYVIFIQEGLNPQFSFTLMFHFSFTFVSY